MKVLGSKSELYYTECYTINDKTTLSYFPDPIAIFDDENDDETDELDRGDGPPVTAPAAAEGRIATAPKVTTIAQRKRARAKDPVAPGARNKPGPKPKNALPPGSTSIYQFYTKK